MLNRTPLNESPLNAPGNVDLTINYKGTFTGAAVQFNDFSATGTGEHYVIIRRYSAEQSGQFSLYQNFSGLKLSGIYDLGATTYVASLTGASLQFNTFQPELSGAASTYQNIDAVIARGAFGISGANYTITTSGAFDVGYEHYQPDSIGASELFGFSSYVANNIGAFAQLITYQNQIQGLTRIANDNLNRFELYIGTDGEPDFTANPAETFTNLPHTTSALTTGFEYRLVVRKRNAYNLLSKNVSSWTIDLTTGATAADTPPIAPSFSAGPSAGGTITIKAEYLYLTDPNPADTYLIYYTTNGTDPNPATDTPLTGLMSKADGIARLNYTTSAFADGTTVKVLIRTRRTGTPSVDSINSNIVTTTADTDGPAAPVGQALFGKIAGQR